MDRNGSETRTESATSDGAATATSGILPAGAVVERLATGATWSEGPLYLPRERVVRWSDIPGDRILQWSETTGETTVHRTEVEFTNGRTLDADGSTIQCSHGRRAVEREVDGVVTTLVDRWEGRRFNSPNDVVIHSDGSIWFTDPPYGIVQPDEGHPGEREYGGHHVFRLDPRTGELRSMITSAEHPNGLAFSPDESVLYVSDTSAALEEDGSGNHCVHAFDVDPEGSRCSNARVLAVIEPGVPDGFRVDVDGRLWVSSADSVQVLSTTGEVLVRISVPEVVGNLCFGGPDGTDLFIAATTSLYRIPTTTRDASSVRRLGPTPSGG